MGLAQHQAALAQLFVDAEARKEFAADPRAFAHRRGLEGADAERLAKLTPAALNRHAASLTSKRSLDLAKALPATAKALGPDFRALVRRAIDGRGFSRNPCDDAGAFTALVAQEARARRIQPHGIADLARFELAALRASRLQWGVICRVFRRPPAAIVGASRHGLYIAIWMRAPGGRLRSLRIGF